MLATNFLLLFFCSPFIRTYSPHKTELCFTRFVACLVISDVWCNFNFKFSCFFFSCCRVRIRSAYRSRLLYISFCSFYTLNAEKTALAAVASVGNMYNKFVFFCCRWLPLLNGTTKNQNVAITNPPFYIATSSGAHIFSGQPTIRKET